MPGDREHVLAKAPERGADALILDLEDAVAPDRKQAAREMVADFLRGREAGGAPSLWVRINAGTVDEDIEAVASQALKGVILAKADGPDDVARADETLGRAEGSLGLPQGSFTIAPLVETARGLLALAGITTAPRVAHLAMGEADLTSELGIRPSRGAPELLPLRLQLIVASAAAGIPAPTASVSTDFRDLDAFRASTQALVRLGFGARAAIHPAQVAIINEALTPSEEETARAEALIKTLAAGSGVATDAEGRMVDEAVVRGARDVLARTPHRHGP